MMCNNQHHHTIHHSPTPADGYTLKRIQITLSNKAPKMIWLRFYLS